MGETDKRFPLVDRLLDFFNGNLEERLDLAQIKEHPSLSSVTRLKFLGTSLISDSYCSLSYPHYSSRQEEGKTTAFSCLQYRINGSVPIILPHASKLFFSVILCCDFKGYFHIYVSEAITIFFERV